MLKSDATESQSGKVPMSRDGESISTPLQMSAVQSKDTNKSKKTVDFSALVMDQMPPRPSTSAGLDSASKKRAMMEKETKDDLYFNPLAVHGKGTQFYSSSHAANLPTPASSPTKSAAPVMPRKSSMKRPIERPATPDSLDNITSTLPIHEPVIGMALGSPSQHPDTFHQSPLDLSTLDSDNNSSADAWTVPAPQPKQKQSRWKFLGGLFGTRKTESSGFYQVQPEISGPMPQFETEMDPFLSSAQTQRPRSRSRSRSKSVKDKHSKDKPDMRRHNTAPLQFDLSSSQAPPPVIVLDEQPWESRPGISLLDIEIPSTKMDRYSVMFNGILQNPSQQTASSLLARRQATLEKLKTVTEALSSKEYMINAREQQNFIRPTSSPQPGKSPSSKTFLQVQSVSRTESPTEERAQLLGLQRSKSSPAALSPGRPFFALPSRGPPHSDSNGNDVWVDSRGVIRRGPPLSVRTDNEAQSSSQSTQANSRDTTDWLETSRLNLDSPEIPPRDYHGHLPPLEECEVEDIYDPFPFPIRQEAKDPQRAISDMSDPSTLIQTPSNSTSATSITTPKSATSVISKTIKESRMQAPTKKANQASETASQVARARARATTTTTTPKISTSLTATASAIPRRKANIVTHTYTHPNSSSIPATGPKSPEEVEAHLKSAADLSIARQINISQQQRHLLQPLKIGTTTVKGITFPTPISGVVGTTSPLSAVASKATEERDKVVSTSGTSPSTGSKKKIALPGESSSIQNEKGKEKLVQGVKPSTPTLVLIENDIPDNLVTSNEIWRGGKAPLSLAERRKKSEHEHDHASGRGSGEITIGHVQGTELSGKGKEMGRVLKARELRELQHRKSERAVVERISTERKQVDHIIVL